MATILIVTAHPLIILTTLHQSQKQIAYSQDLDFKHPLLT